MNLNPLIEEARSRVEYKLPRHIRFRDVVDFAYQDITDAVAEKVHFALEQAMLGAQSVLKTQADDYISGLTVNDDLTIGIDAKVRYLEDGYDSHQMLENLVTGPKSKVSKSGNLYNIIPIGKVDSTKTKRAMSQKAKEVISEGAYSGVSNRKLQDIVDDMSETLKMAQDVKSQPAKGFATASSKQNAAEKWVHPGFSGVNQLDQINTQLKVDLVDSVVAIIEDKAWRMS
jgi:hypothetical protein